MNILIIELNKYHTEVFPVYENLLPYFFKTKDIRFFYYYLPDPQQDLKVVYQHAHSIISPYLYFLIRNSGLRIAFFKRKIQNLVHKLKIDAVVFNSVEPKRNLEIFKRLKAEIKLALVHNPKKVAFQKEQNEYYFVPSLTLYNNYKEIIPIDGYLLPFYKPYPTEHQDKMDRPLLAGVQGWVNFNRRDYEFLIEICLKLNESGFKGVVFNVIGGNNRKGGKRLRDLIDAHGLGRYFRLHEFLSDRAFFNEIEQCDLLIPLLGPAQSRYFMDKTTASFSHAVAYNKPMVLFRENARAWHLNEDTQYIYDDLDSCVRILKNVKDLDSKKECFKRWRDEIITKNKEFLSGMPFHAK